MKTKTEDEAVRKIVDTLVCRAADLAVREAGAPLSLLLDRMLTYAAAQAVHDVGKAEAARLFDACAKHIRRGDLDLAAVRKGRPQ